MIYEPCVKNIQIMMLLEIKNNEAAGQGRRPQEKLLGTDKVLAPHFV
jgi:hypothetical protein